MIKIRVDKITGRILESVVFKSSKEYLKDWITVEEEPDLSRDDKYYEKGLKDRVKSEMVFDGDYIRNIPVPATLYVDGVPYAIVENVVKLELPRVKQYRIRVQSESWKYYPLEVILDADD